MRWIVGTALLAVVVLGGLSPLIPLMLERSHWKALMRPRHRAPKR